MEYLERVSPAFRDFFFYYDETPLLVVDSSEIDFVEDPDDLKICCAKSTAPAPGSITSFRAKASARENRQPRANYPA